MYAAKREGRNTFESSTRRCTARAQLPAGSPPNCDARSSPRELFVVYQPLFRLDDGSFTGVEALVRWRHPERGTIPPAEFIPLAEQHGLIAGWMRSFLKKPVDSSLRGERATPRGRTR